MSRRATPGSGWWLLALLVVTAAGCFDAIVSYPCATGFQACGESCVDLQVSAAHCGACGNPCQGACQAGQCLAPDAGPLDAGADLAVDAPEPDAPPDLPPDLAPDAPADTAPDLAPDRAPDLAPDAEPDGPPIVCDPPLTNCSERCVQLTDDPDNCGRCGNRCSGGLCAASLCGSQSAGHVVAIGHDYQVTRSGMNNLVGNAVLLSGTNPIRVLTYQGFALPAAVVGTNSAIAEVAGNRGVEFEMVDADVTGVVAKLPDHDVFLIYAQAGASDTELTALGRYWANALTAFIGSGKTIVLLDGASNTNTGTVKILSSAGLFAGSTRTVVTGEILTVVAPGDALALNVPRTYRAETTSAAFITLEAVKVVQTATGGAVVVHRVF
jgi:hypothetical protein